MKTNKFLLTLLGSAVLLAGCGPKDNSSAEQKNKTPEQPTTATSEVKQAFDFKAMDKDGNEVKLSDFKGKKVYINVWASWCGPCKIEMPELEKTYQKFKNNDDFVFLSITSPSDGEFKNTNPLDQDKETILGLAEQKKISYPILFDVNDRFMVNYGVRAFPTHIFINSDGTISKNIAGAMNEQTLEKNIAELK